jgi:hypothetical protein
MEQQDTRQHYVVTLEVTLKVQDTAEATELAEGICHVLPGIKGVSQYFAPTVVGTPQVRDTAAAPLNGDEQNVLKGLAASLDEQDEQQD